MFSFLVLVLCPIALVTAGLASPAHVERRKFSILQSLMDDLERFNQLQFAFGADQNGGGQIPITKCPRFCAAEF